MWAMSHRPSGSSHARARLRSQIDDALRAHRANGARNGSRRAGRAGSGAGAARVVRQPPTYRPVYAAHERDHHITTSGRRALPASLFALPPGPAEVRRGIAGRVPFDTIKRARSGLSRLGMMRHRGEIDARALRRARGRILAHWPSIDAG